jgi:DNA-binding transcriptional MocR family regulator
MQSLDVRVLLPLLLVLPAVFTCSCELLSVPLDGHGLLPAALDAILTQRQAAGLALPRLLYTIPTGQNPTGSVMGAERMRQVYELARKWDLIILEDDAYFWLQYPQGADSVPGLNLRREWQLSQFTHSRA